MRARRTDGLDSWLVAPLLVFAGSVEAGTLSQTMDEPGNRRSFAGGHRHQRIEDHPGDQRLVRNLCPKLDVDHRDKADGRLTEAHLGKHADAASVGAVERWRAGTESVRAPVRTRPWCDGARAWGAVPIPDANTSHYSSTAIRRPRQSPHLGLSRRTRLAMSKRYRLTSQRGGPAPVRERSQRRAAVQPLPARMPPCGCR